MLQARYSQRFGNRDGLLERLFNQLFAFLFKIAYRSEVGLLIPGEVHVDHILMSQLRNLSRRPHGISRRHYHQPQQHPAGISRIAGFEPILLLHIIDIHAIHDSGNQVADMVYRYEFANIRGQ